MRPEADSRAASISISAAQHTAAIIQPTIPARQHTADTPPASGPDTNTPGCPPCRRCTAASRRCSTRRRPWPSTARSSTSSRCARAAQPSSPVALGRSPVAHLRRAPQMAKRSGTAAPFHSSPIFSCSPPRARAHTPGRAGRALRSRPDAAGAGQGDRAAGADGAPRHLRQHTSNRAARYVALSHGLLVRPPAPAGEPSRDTQAEAREGEGQHTRAHNGAPAEADPFLRRDSRLSPSCCS